MSLLSLSLYQAHGHPLQLSSLHVCMYLTQAYLGCSLIRASRPTNRVDKGYKPDPPWGQPEPITRGQHVSTCMPAVHQSLGLAGGADSLIPGQARHQYGLLHASGPALHQVRSWHCGAALHMALSRTRQNYFRWVGRPWSLKTKGKCRLEGRARLSSG